LRTLDIFNILHNTIKPDSKKEMFLYDCANDESFSYNQSSFNSYVNFLYNVPLVFQIEQKNFKHFGLNFDTNKKNYEKLQNLSYFEYLLLWQRRFLSTRTYLLFCSFHYWGYVTGRFRDLQNEEMSDVIAKSVLYNAITIGGHLKVIELKFLRTNVQTVHSSISKDY
jgi:hypothetical protein